MKTIENYIYQVMLSNHFEMAYNRNGYIFERQQTLKSANELINNGDNTTEVTFFETTPNTTNKGFCIENVLGDFLSAASIGRIDSVLFLHRFILHFLVMLQFTILGNLGADAEKKEYNGRPFVSFRVAHSEKRQDGTEATTWVSCVMNGDGGNVLQYLKRGQKVFVQGRGRVKTFSSPKTHQIEAGLDVSVDRVELCGQNLTAEAVRAWLNANLEQANEIVNDLPF